MSTQCRAIKSFSAQKGHNESDAFRKIKLPSVTIMAWKEKSLKVERRFRGAYRSPQGRWWGWSEGSAHGHREPGRDCRKHGQSSGRGG